MAAPPDLAGQQVLDQGDSVTEDPAHADTRSDVLRLPASDSDLPFIFN